MSQEKCEKVENSSSSEPEEKQKPKYYTEKHKEYMRKYRAQHGSYTEVQKKAIKKYVDKMRQDAKLYRELISKGVVTDQKE